MRLARVNRDELNAWNAGIEAAREEYRTAPNLNWCDVRMCMSQAHSQGMCIGHKRAIRQGALPILDEQVRGLRDCA